MELSAKRVLGNTWCIATPMAWIPYYQINETDIILLDSGYMLHGELEAWIKEHNFKVRAILNTHEHWDHVVANGNLQREYGAKIYMPKAEAALVETPIGKNVLHEPGNFMEIQNFYSMFSFRVDEEISAEDGMIEVCGIPFEVIHTPGHSLDHVSFITPDRVLYVGDVLMSADELRRAKISCAVSHEVDIESKKKLKRYSCEAYILAHGSIERDITALIDENIAYVHQRGEDLLQMIHQPMSMEEIIRTVWKQFGLRSGSYYKNLEVGNMIRSLVKYMVSEKKLENRYYDGVDYYARSGNGEQPAWQENEETPHISPWYPV